MPTSHIFWFNEISKEDLDHIGEKGVHLAELNRAGVSIPEGFVISSTAFNKFLKDNNLDKKSKHLISTVNHSDPASLKQVSNHIYKHFHDGHLSTDFKKDLYNSYKKLSGKLNDAHVKVMPSVNAHSHATKKDHHEEIKGEASLIHHIKDYWASNFSEFNLTKNKANSDFVKSLIIQKVIEPEKSGKIYTIHPDSYEKDKVVIKSMLGHYDDQINLITLPDYYVIKKSDYGIIEKHETNQEKATKKVGGVKKKVKLSKATKSKKRLNSKEIEKIMHQAKLAEKLSYFPQEIDWIAEGDNIYLIHTKPLS